MERWTPSPSWQALSTDWNSVAPQKLAETKHSLDLFLHRKPAQRAQDTGTDDEHNVQNQIGILKRCQMVHSRQSQNQIRQEQDQYDD